MGPYLIIGGNLAMIAFFHQLEKNGITVAWEFVKWGIMMEVVIGLYMLLTKVIVFL